jgi:hypothetical protein
MTKLYFCKLFSNIGVPLDENTIKRLLLLSFGIAQSKTVNIARVNDEISLTESGCKSEDSQYNYLLKTFQTGNYTNLLKSIYRFLVLHFYNGENSAKLLIDRTNWCIGKTPINILTIGLLTADKLLIPLIWEDLGQAGNSNGETRLKLIKKLLVWWQEMNIPLPTFEIIGDREFIGEAWLVSLAQLKVKYVVRSRCNLQFDVCVNEPLTDEKMEKFPEFAKLTTQFTTTKNMSVLEIHDYLIKKDLSHVKIELTDPDCQAIQTTAKVFVVENAATQTYQSKRQPYIYFITNMDNIPLAAQDYRDRWKIELCFKHLKSAGFNLEDFNMSGPHKTNIMMAILSLVYAITLKQEPQTETTIALVPQKICKYKQSKPYPRKSSFRKGRTFISKLKSLDTFLTFFCILCQKILAKLFKLNNLRISNLFAQ